MADKKTSNATPNGNSSNAPGHDRNGPGNSENAPGHNKVVDTPDDKKPEVCISDACTVEGNDGKTHLCFTVKLDCPTDKPIYIAFHTKDGTATTADCDYVEKCDVVCIEAGKDCATIEICVVGDCKVECDEEMYCVIDEGDCYTVGDGCGVGTIKNDDAALV